MVLFFRLYDEPTCDLDTGLFSPGDSISFLATSDPCKSQPHSGDLSKPGEMRDERVSLNLSQATAFPKSPTSSILIQNKWKSEESERQC